MRSSSAEVVPTETSDSFRQMSAPARRAMAEFAASRHGVVVRSLAASFGLSHRDIRNAKQLGWLTEPVRGVLVVSGHPPTWEQHLAIATSASAARPVVSNGAAARLFALDGFDSADGELAVQRPGRINRTAAAGLVIHQAAELGRVDRYERNGLPCTTLARTLTDLGSTESKEMVWRALIAARRIHRVNPLWLQQTAIRLHRPGQAGSGVLIEALGRWRAEGVLPDSWFEELLRCLLDHRRHPTPATAVRPHRFAGQVCRPLRSGDPFAATGNRGAQPRVPLRPDTAKRPTRTATCALQRVAGRFSTSAGTRKSARRESWPESPRSVPRGV